MGEAQAAGEVAVTLEDLIRELRLELAGEVPIRLHESAGLGHGKSTKGGAAGDLGGIEYGSILPKSRAVGWTGLPFAPAFERRLSHPDWWGINELAASSILEVGDFCRSRHLSDLHRCPGETTSLCERIVAAVTELGQPIGQVAWREGLDAEVVYALAFQGLRHAYAWRHRKVHAYMRAAKELERDTRVICPLCIGRTVVMRRTRSAA